VRDAVCEVDGSTGRHSVDTLRFYSDRQTQHHAEHIRSAIVKKLLAVASLLAAASAQAAGLSYIGQQIVPSGFAYAQTAVGGLSSIDYDAAGQRYLAISDDRSSLNPARFYSLGLDLTKFQRSATPGMAGVMFTGVTTILQPDGTPFAPNGVDPEGLRLNASTGTLIWSNEGARAASGFQNPTLREMRLDGSPLRDFAVPSRYHPMGSTAGTAPGDSGIYNNLAFESVALSIDRKTVWTATENALVQDGPPASVATGSNSRLLGFDVASGAAGAEFIIDVSPVALAPNPAGAFATNGLTELLAIGERRFIGIERSFAIGAATAGTPTTGNTIRLYEIDARNATDVSGLDSIAGQTVVSATKTLLLDLSTLKNDDGSALALDNIEGLTFGPAFNGQQTLILVSDNNFSPTQFTQFVALGMAGVVPEPATWALCLSGVLALSLAVRGKQR
jgi:hypothetical protein